ncbi:hypothetical protein [Fusobacterium varium]|jgi:hypothetical protein|uniref:hypothetical protein n=1 Tax=Fusobacterium varium TaxID=856 RepID=UPI0020465F28|nr:hypothetical protein [Fusobacterium varium]DAE89490.1 MAG TPA: hypothetical protein [Caudoviricetes sp.]
MTIKKFIRRNLPEIYVLSVFITVLTVQLAYECRGYFALGGEILIPLIPVMMHIWIVMEE